MKRNQRIRYDIAAATRRNGLGAPRTAELKRITARQNRSNLGVGGLRTMGIFYAGGDYWN